MNTVADGPLAPDGIRGSGSILFDLRGPGAKWCTIQY